MSLEQLTSVVTPPVTPRSVLTDAEILALESELGISFPSDYIQMCQRYGRGTFYSRCTGVSLVLPNQRYLFDLETSQIRLSLERKPDLPYRAFPFRPGLLPWAFDEGDAEVCWLVDDDASTRWPIITRLGERYDAAAFQRFELSATEFLTKAFRYEIEVALWDPLRFGYDQREAAELLREPVTFHSR